MIWRVVLAAVTILAVFGVAQFLGAELSGLLLGEASRNTPAGVRFNTDLFVRNQIFLIIQGGLVLCTIPFVIWLRTKSVLDGIRTWWPALIMGVAMFLASVVPAIFDFEYQWPRIILALLATIVSLAAIHFILPHQQKQ